MTDDTSLGSQSSKLKMLHFRQVQEFRFDDKADADGPTAASLLLFRDPPPPSWLPRPDPPEAAVVNCGTVKKNKLCALDERRPRLPKLPPPPDASSEFSDDRRLYHGSRFPAAFGYSSP